MANLDIGRVGYPIPTACSERLLHTFAAKIAVFKIESSAGDLNSFFQAVFAILLFP